MAVTIVTTTRHSFLTSPPYLALTHTHTLTKKYTIVIDSIAIVEHLTVRPLIVAKVMG